MDPICRVTSYLTQTGHVQLTARQQRQHDRMAARDGLRDLGHLPPHGASGVPVRRPLARSEAGRGIA
jgi:hypothetical protein